MPLPPLPLARFIRLRGDGIATEPIEPWVEIGTWTATRPHWERNTDGPVSYVIRMVEHERFRTWSTLPPQAWAPPNPGQTMVALVRLEHPGSWSGIPHTPRTKIPTSSSSDAHTPDPNPEDTRPAPRPVRVPDATVVDFEIARAARRIPRDATEPYPDMDSDLHQKYAPHHNTQHGSPLDEKHNTPLDDPYPDIPIDPDLPIGMDYGLPEDTDHDDDRDIRHLPEDPYPDR